MEKGFIHFNNIVAAVDKAEVDVQDVDTMKYLKDATNLVPFESAGDLVQAPGHTVVTAAADLPTIETGFVFDDLYYFSVNRDEKDITFVTHVNPQTSETKMFIKPWYNPARNYNNYNPLKDESSWINEWLELTENYYYEIDSIASSPGNEVVIVETPGKADDFFNGWFLAVHEVSQKKSRWKFQQVTDYVESTKTFTTKGKLFGNAEAEQHIFLCRFPVVYLYGADVVTYEGWGDAFNGRPTQFFYNLGQLRMPCGKNQRPLIFEMIEDRSYLNGTETVLHDGFWFDFEQTPQTLKGSQVSSFLFNQSPADTGPIAYLTSAFTWSATAPADGKDYIKFELRNLSTAIINVKVEDRDGHARLEWHGNVLDISVPSWDENSWEADSQALANFLIGLGLTEFTMTATNGTVDMRGLAGAYNVYPFSTTAGFNEPEANNQAAKNWFLGTWFEVTTLDAPAGADDWTDVNKYKFILTAMIDNRNPILISHGTIRPDNAGDAQVAGANQWGAVLKMTSWFSRRITGFSYYTNKIETIVGGQFKSVLRQATTYPYYEWSEDMDVEEIPLLSTYRIDDFRREFGNSVGKGIVITEYDATDGINAYTWVTNDSAWFVRFSEEYNSIATEGTRLSFITDNNRRLHDDITMNYTRTAFYGSANGRAFIMGCRNTVEKEIFDNDDIIFYNNYAAGVSQYAVFLRNKRLLVGPGDKDVLVDIINIDNYIVICKNYNIYLLDAAVAEDIKYRVYDSMLQKGVQSRDAMVATSYGLVIPSNDTVYLMSLKSGQKPLLTPFNGRLRLYKEKFVGKPIQSVFNSNTDELLLMSREYYSGVIDPNVSDNPPLNVDTHIMVYKFQTEMWANYLYKGTTSVDSVKPLLWRQNQSRDICIVNYHSTTQFNIVKIDRASSRFKGATGNNITIEWIYEIHTLPYADIMKDLQVVWLALRAAFQCTGAKTLTIELSGEGTTKSRTISIPEMLTYREEVITDILQAMLGFKTVVGLKIYNGSSNAFDRVTINKLTLCLAQQNRPKITAIT